MFLTAHPERQCRHARDGMYRYDSSFAFPVNGKKYLYDIVGIKENTADAIDLQKRETRLAANKAALHGGAFDVIVSQQGNTVKSEAAEMSDRDVKFSPKDKALQSGENGGTIEEKYSMKENKDGRFAENYTERSELETIGEGKDSSKTERRFYEEAERRGQTCRVLRKDGSGNNGRGSGRPVRFTEIAHKDRSKNAAATQTELERLGVSVFVHGGDLEILGADGTILSGGAAGSINGSAVGISNDIKIAPADIDDTRMALDGLFPGQIAPVDGASLFGQKFVGPHEVSAAEKAVVSR